MTYSRDLIILFIIMCATFFTRVFPFILFGRHQEPPKLIQYIGKMLPSAVIAILIVYCLKAVTFREASAFLPQFFSVAVVIGLHLWKRNNLLSIGLGTLCYMLLIQVVFK